MVEKVDPLKRLEASIADVSDVYVIAGTDAQTLRSEAMLRMLDWLRINVQGGRIKKVVAFDSAIASGNADRNQQMAANLRNLRPNASDVVVALTGSVHAQGVKYGEGNDAFEPAGTLLPPQDTIRILIRGDGGTAFGCEDQGCHIYPVTPRVHSVRGLKMSPSERGFDGVLELGMPETASNPANSN
jgi:hypothetical protein